MQALTRARKGNTVSNAPGVVARLMILLQHTGRSCYLGIQPRSLGNILLRAST